MSGLLPSRGALQLVPANPINCARSDSVALREINSGRIIRPSSGARSSAFAHSSPTNTSSPDKSNCLPARTSVLETSTVPESDDARVLLASSDVSPKLAPSETCRDDSRKGATIPVCMRVLNRILVSERFPTQDEAIYAVFTERPHDLSRWIPRKIACSASSRVR